MTEEIITLTTQDFKGVKCRIDMYGDRIIGYVSEDFIKSLNKVINEKATFITDYISKFKSEDVDNAINQITNMNLRKELDRFENRNIELEKVLEHVRNKINTLENLFKEFDFKVLSERVSE